MKMTKYSDVHPGTDDNIQWLVRYTLAEMRKLFPDVTNKELKAILCETLARNMVQNEIMDMAAYIYNTANEE